MLSTRGALFSMSGHAENARRSRSSLSTTQPKTQIPNLGKTVRRERSFATDSIILTQRSQTMGSRLQQSLMICTPQTTFKLSNRIGLLTIEVGSTFLKSDSGATNRFLLTGSGDQTPDNGDIKIEYHPHSGKGTHILSSDEYRESFRDHSEPTPPDDDRPWLPFSSQEDFEFTEFVHDAALNQKQINRLIKLIRTCQKEPNKFTFRNFKDMRASLDDASKLLTPVTTF
jgi:hypothetical protein